MKIFVLSNNDIIINKFMEAFGDGEHIFHIYDDFDLEPNQIIRRYDFAMSLHSQKIFPKELTDKMICINIHPGYNPVNRGWFPHVFSLASGDIAGATIHIMDEKIDHGPIIARKRVPYYLWDTSETLYERIIDAEIELCKAYLPVIFRGNYHSWIPEHEGWINTKKDFEKLCKIELDQTSTFRMFYNRIRALSHGDYKNAYIVDGDKKIYFKIEILND